MVFATTPNKWIFLFTPSFRSVTSARVVYSEKCHIFLFEKHVHIYTTQSTTWQSEANWSRWPLLNHITGDHTSLFIGHKAKHICFHSTEFPRRDLNRDSSPVSVVLSFLKTISEIKLFQGPSTPLHNLFRARWHMKKKK